MKKKENKQPQIMLSIFIAVIMISSVIGFMFGRDEQNTMDYNGVEFYQRNFRWITRVNGQEVVFDNFPASVEHINVSQDIISRIKNTFEVDTTYDEDSKYEEELAVIQHEMGIVLDSVFNIYVRQGMTEQNSYNITVIDCNDATQAVPVLYFMESNQTSIYLDDNCIIAKARSGVEFVRLKDRLLYGILGII
jgi:hypothetical protein